ncbi:Hypothetical predicted protein [Octopus vulgaris]|uniref:CCHC-type domain-containing protein n=1 Tax=Octopus vulgaris TaxID=6645 RepID=A0AA36EWV4_OCTVU|nr:Hypothetical predicted protein [Octopus vulgaris]
MENLPHPKDLDFNQENLAAAWKKWKKEFNLFLIATESDMKPDKVKTSMFLTCIGSKGRDIHSTLDFDSPDEEMNLQTVIEKFDAYCEPRKNITFLRHKFFTCGQAEHQKFDEYVVELRQKAQQCEFGNLTDNLTKDILICGIRDMRLRERLLREPNLDLQKTIQAGQSAEQTRLQSRMLNATSETRDNEISRVYSQHDRKGAKTQITRHMQSRHQNEQGGSDRKPAKFQAPSQHYVTNCHYCGYNHKRNKCPAFHKTCEKCKKQGHYAKMCKSRKFVHKVEIHTDDESDDDTHALEMITANNSRVHKIEKFKTPRDIWTVELKVNNSNVTFKIDTGADYGNTPKFGLRLKNPTVLESKGSIMFDNTQISAIDFGQIENIYAQHKGNHNKLLNFDNNKESLNVEGIKYLMKVNSKLTFSMIFCDALQILTLTLILHPKP